MSPKKIQNILGILCSLRIISEYIKSTSLEIVNYNYLTILTDGKIPYVQKNISIHIIYKPCGFIYNIKIK